MTSYVGRNAILYTTDPGSNTYKCAPPPGVLPTIDFGAGGANAEPYKADITSYDYDAPISEAGDLTSKYFAIRSTLKKFADSYKLSFSGATHSTPMDFPKKAYGSVKLSAVVSIFNAPEIYDDEPLSEKIPQSFETLEVYSGYVLYEAYMPKKIPDFATLSILKVRDRATVYLDEEPRAIFSRSSGLNSLSLLQKDRGKKLSILVENQGYVNYDPHMQGDLKGVVFVNGRNMGRYWPSVGPQVTLYIPGCYLKAHPGINKLVILEEEKVPEVLEMRFRDRHKLNSTLIY
ncbi:unnamed protein product [Bemisia tabaci]|uniref:Beta-galactosidase n=1 Tax=Bemisia tabaci TaxID=7038 RepID=A0A9P0EZT9_BEMTA|nr:unnamed protein product [Bemisia tabaci]